MRKIIVLTILLFVHSGGARPRYVTTIHPFQEILKAVVGDHGEVHRMLPPGASPHTYELRPSDIRHVEAAKALFFGSPTLDAWALKFNNRNRIELIELLPEDFLLYFQSPERDKKREATDSDVPASHHHHHGSAIGVDPHFWTDPLTVKALLPALTDTLCSLDPDGCEIYRKNSAKFAKHLDSLYVKIDEKLIPVRGEAVMLSHPFFQYFLKRFGLRLVDIIEIIPGKEPTPRQIKDIIQQVQRENVKAIFDHPQLPDRAAKLVAEAAGLKVYELDPLGGVSGRQTYDELLLYNVQVLLEALQ